MRSALELIIEDGKAENAAKVNNKAQAITVTLIDFVRLNVLKPIANMHYRRSGPSPFLPGCRPVSRKIPRAE